MSDGLLFGGRAADMRLAREYGVSPGRIRALLHAGALRQVVRGVYLDAGAPDDLATRADCLRLRLPPGAAVSRRTAAWLYGVDGREPGERNEPLVLECTVAPGCEPLRRPGVRCYVAPLAGDTALVDGIPTTTPTRTAVDVLRWLRPHMGLAVADALASKGLIVSSRLPMEVERFARAPGVSQARRLAPFVEPLTESAGESWLRLRMIDAGFPRPEAQIVVPQEAGPAAYRLDLGWRRKRVAVEYDGEEYHSSPAQRRHDEQRRDELWDRYGWIVLGVGKGDVLGRSTRLERTVGGLLGVEPRALRRLW